MNPFKLRFLRRGTPTPTPTPTPSAAVTYDTSIGNGVDTNGRADLTPRVGAKIFYVNPTTGSNSNTSTQAQNPATPLATIAKAVSFVTDGEGDHVLVAQGMSYPLGLAYIGGKGGFSAAYPFVIQSYDPADPTNQAKWGTADGSNRPDINITGTDSAAFIQGIGPAYKYHALRGLRFNGQNGDSAGMNAFNSSAGTPDYLLFENCDFDTTQISVASNFGVGYIQHVIFRSCSFHDAWGAGGRGQGIFTSVVNFFTVEDCAFIHAGWKAGLARADSPSIGGPSAQAHPLYEQDDVRNSIIRRNVFSDGSSDSGVLKGGGIYTGNLSISNPISVSFGDGNLSSIYAPLGIYGEASFNAFIGNGWGIETVNIKQGSGSSFHHNALAHGDTSFSYANYALMADDKPDLSAPGSNYNISLPTYPIFDHNVVYLWGASQVIHLNSPPGLLADIHATYTNNLWDDATSGSNTNNSGATFSNAYTATSIVQALGYADLATAQAAWKINPQLHGWRAGPGLVLAGYGVADPGLVDLTTNMALTAGYAPVYAATGQFIGAHDGSTFSVSGLPSGVTFDSNSRSWTYDGSNTTVSSGTFTITETNGASNHTTTIPWSISARPVLSGLSVTAGTGQVTINVSSNTGSGTIFVEALTSSTAPVVWDIRAGLDATDSPNGAALWPHTSQAVSATGAQTPIVLTGLTHGTTYYVHIAQVDSGNNPSLTSTSGSFIP